MSDPSNVVFCWPIASNYGWGVRGTGYALTWPGIAVSAHSELTASLGPGDPRQALLAARIEQSRRVQSQIIGAAGAHVDLPDPVLVPLGNDLTQQPVAFGRMLRGRPHVACPVFEDIDIVRQNVGKLAEYDVVVVASWWNQKVLADLGVEAKLCHEGIDPVLFNPGVRNRQDDGKFRVFSGGKAEWRKGQDLVIEAFAEFAKDHDNAVLVASWGSPFAWAAKTFEGKWKHGAPPGLHINRPNYHAWVQRAGIKPHQFEWVEPRLNWQTPEIYANVDVAVFPNRCEGGTNFVAMESMASGVPCFLNAAYGQDDLRDSVACWGDGLGLIDQIIAFLEFYYTRGRKVLPGALSSHWTWERHCADVAEIIRNA